ncbi:MAG: amidohydrolase family protein [Fulvivirga sp.]|uniref:amidohydrolase family protein n=1 Tax=Fulvivirga sp. TaxID=1931237 RepID=UPI0032EC2354
MISANSFLSFSIKKTFQILSTATFCLLLSCSSQNEQPEVNPLPSEEAYTVFRNGHKVGFLNITRSGDTLISDYDYKSNGRGPGSKDTIVLNAEGFPVKWDIAGNTTFGNQVEEHFSLANNTASWKDATGKGEAIISEPSFYIVQSGSPYFLFLAARVLLNTEDRKVAALPSGQLELIEMESMQIQSDSASLKLTSYALIGHQMDPDYFILDENDQFFAYISPKFCIIREGYGDQEKEMRLLSEKYAAERFEQLQADFAHNYEGNIRIKNVRIFDPISLTLTEPSSVVVSGDKIIGIEAADAAVQENETVIEGNGGTLVPGLYDMHGHMGDERALSNVLAGVTSVRDMGNDHEVLSELIQKIESGVLAGPRITRLGMIEGKSPTNNNNGILVENEQQALDAVDFYHQQGYHGIKIYNSMKGEWIPAISKKAKELGLFMCGHVPAFSNANAMIKGGYDEMTHINQIMLGWVLEPDEDTRTLLRFTAMKRFGDLDLTSDKVVETLDLMVKNKVGVDPTLAIHEYGLLGRNGTTRAGVVDYAENMPVNTQRNYKVALFNISDEEEDKAYRLAYDKIIETLREMKKSGIFIVPGTDLGGGFNQHRELELYQQLGYTPAEILKLGSYDMANYLGHENLGEIKTGKLADFFLVPGNPVENIKAIKTISMVSRGGTIYYPSEVYPSFGIQPFCEKPVVN